MTVLSQAGLYNQPNFVISDIWLLCELQEIIEAEIALLINCHAHKSIDHVYQALHQLAGLAESSDNSYFIFSEEILI